MIFVYFFPPTATPLIKYTNLFYVVN